MNFSIIVPGDCNADCSFCFWEREPQAPNYLMKLRQVLDTFGNLSDTYSCSLTGGEPTISLLLHDILTILEQQANFSKVVLTTNATGLADKRYFPADLAAIVDHVNISRHAVEDNVNLAIFQRRPDRIGIPTMGQLADLVDPLNQEGIDVTINCVLCGQFGSRSNLLHFIKCMRELGASAVSFRKQHGNLDESEEEKWFVDHKVVLEDSCPVCRVNQQLIYGMPIYWKASALEPSEDLGEVYELIFHPSGQLTADWAGKKTVIFANGKPYIANESKTITKALEPTIEQRLDRMENNIQALIQATEIRRRRESVAEQARHGWGCGTIRRGC